MQCFLLGFQFVDELLETLKDQSVGYAGAQRSVVQALRLCRPQIAGRALPRHWRTKIRDVAARVHLGRQQKRDSLAWSTSVVVVRGIAATRSYVSRSRLGGLCVRASLVEGRVEAVWLSSRRRFASSERRSSREIVCLKRRRSMTPPRAYGS
jgi:hypothetical protein